ncbi:hypothetical protein LTS14_008744 [Recurvomyces mirabilis]|uniref:uncharacterized protein n=1 Tax=Recurvomyces mirabilis TaxID=574656 RepID=UPI002DDEB15D|nr:hypothetical protein LTS14_008744 [Recurvomyces mirabilis]
MTQQSSTGDAASETPSNGANDGVALQQNLQNLSRLDLENHQVAGSFWSTLTSEVRALANILEHDEHDQADGPTTENILSLNEAPSAHTHPATSIFDNDPILATLNSTPTSPQVLLELDTDVEIILYEAYLEHVQIYGRLFHIPTLDSLVRDRGSYMGKPASSPCNRLLRAALIYAGANALTRSESISISSKTKDKLVGELRLVVEFAMHQADLMNTTDLSSVQALWLYISSLRVLDSTRRAWTLVGLLVRIARALNVHRDQAGETPYQAQLRRRLWYNVVQVDFYLSFDRGAEPIIHPDSFSRSLPSNCNDDEFGEHSLNVPNHNERITDMSVALIQLEGAALSLQADQPRLNWQDRLDIVRGFEKKLKDIVLPACPLDHPSRNMLVGMVEAITTSLTLRAVRPFHYIHGSTAPPPVSSPWVMQIALDQLRFGAALWSTHTDGWRTPPWIPWHPIAVVLAGLCSIRDNVLAGEAWRLVTLSLDHYMPDIADSKDGMLWKPIARLYKNAVAFRDASPLKSRTSATGSDTLDSIPTPNKPLFSSENWSLDLSALPAIESPSEPMVVMQDTPQPDDSWLDWEAIMKDMDEIMAGDDWSGFPFVTSQ